MSDWIKAFNPTATIATEGEARNAARASAIAIFMGVAFGLLGVYMMMNGGLAAIETAMATQGGADPQLASMTGAIAQFTLYMMIGVTVVQLILGFVQWTRPNMVIPIIFIILVVYGLGSAVLNKMMASQMELPETPMDDVWFVALNFIVLIIQLILHISGVRGASALSKFRDAQAY